MKVQKLTLTALFAALCAIGGLIKIPSQVGSLALDSLPALLASAFLSPMLTGIAAMLGHIASALYAGFPLGPFHLLLAAEMFIILALFAYCHQKGRHVLKWTVFIVGNGLLAPLPFYFLVSPAFFIGVWPLVMIATSLNAVIAMVAFPFVQRLVKERWKWSR